MADNNSSNNKRRNVTGSYPGVTGSYKRPDPYPKSTPEAEKTVSFEPARKTQSSAQRPQSKSEETARPVREPVKKTKKAESRSERIRKESAPKDTAFDWKLWFSSENVKGFLKHLRYYGVIVIASLLLTFAIVSVSNDVFAFIKPDESIVVSIPEGGSTEAIAKELKNAGVIKHPTVFRLYCKLKKAEGKFQYGDYNLNSSYSYDIIISKLKKSSLQAETVTVTIPVGATQDDIIEILTAGKYTNILDIEQALNSYEYEDFEFVQDIPERRCRLEGYLPAGDYELYKGESAVSIVSKMLTRFKETMLTEQNLAYIESTGKTLDELIITASLVQRECVQTDSYKNAASVLNNRLSSQTDNYLQLTSTINYVLPEVKTVLSSDDKKTDSTYNTYLYPGLPPGPVCTPTAEAFDAVINPISTAYMYFVSDSEKTAFSVTYDEHTAALKKAAESAKGTDVIR